MLYIYVIIAIIVIAVSFRCLKNTFEGIIPLLCFSFLVSAIMTSIICTVIFFQCDGSLFEKKELYGKTIVMKGDKFIEKADSSRTHTFDNVIKYGYDLSDKKESLMIRKNSWYENSIVNTLCLFNPGTVSKTDTLFHLNKKDYEILESYKNNGK